MIGKIVTGKSFHGCLLYCLHDKEQKHGQATVIKDRAEVLLYNNCYGSDKELVQQFNEVRSLNQKVKKAVLHITLSLAPGEQLGKDKLMEIAEACARDMGFQNNQYIAIGHKDTSHQHLHIVANRIGFDGRTVSDSNSYKKIALFCRKMELKYNLQQVLSPRRYLSQEQRQLPRLDRQKESLKEHIKQSLSTSLSYSQFESKMKESGYQIIKGRGISFLDNKGVKVKGSEVGYPLQQIEQTLTKNTGVQTLSKTFQSEHVSSDRKGYDPRLNGKGTQAQTPEVVQGKESENSLSKTLDLLLQPGKQSDVIQPELFKKKRKKQKRSLRL